MEIKFYKITLGNQTKVVDASVAMDVADEMVSQAGGGIPSIVPCDAGGNAINVRTVVEEKTLPPVSYVVVQARNNIITTKPPVYSDWNNTVVDEAAKVRIEEQHNKFRQAGINIDTSQQFFATGTRMAKEGYDTQRKRAEDYFKQQLLVDAIAELQDNVSNEIRRDLNINAKEIARDINIQNNSLYFKDYVLTEQSLRGLMFRLESPALGYILGVRERVGSFSRTPQNQEVIEQDLERIADTLQYELKRFGDTEFKLRVRENPQDVYCAVSPSYAAADASVVMEQILDQMPKEARGSYAYDATSTSWSLRANLLTPTPVEEQSVGEPYEFYVELNSRDDGAGRFRGGGGINLLRCLNASTYTSKTGDISRVHRGKILLDIRKMIDGATKAAHILVASWGKAREEEIKIPTGLTLEQAFPGLMMHLLTHKDSDLVNVLPGRKVNHAQALTQTYFDQRRDPDKLVKADIAQSWTRYIQDQPFEVRQKGEQAAGDFIVNKQKYDFLLKED